MSAKFETSKKLDIKVEPFRKDKLQGKKINSQQCPSKH